MPNSMSKMLDEAENLCPVCLDHLPVSDDSSDPESKSSGCSSPSTPATSETCQKKDLIARLVPCLHHFHNTCLKTWVKHANTCPICRQEFNIVELTKSFKGPTIDTYVVKDQTQVADLDMEIIDEQMGIYNNDPCIVCDHDDREDILLLCDGCNVPAHTTCIGLDSVPIGDWFCEDCEESPRAQSSRAAALRDWDRLDQNLPPPFAIAMREANRAWLSGIATVEHRRTVQALHPAEMDRTTIRAHYMARAMDRAAARARDGTLEEVYADYFDAYLDAGRVSRQRPPITGSNNGWRQPRNMSAITPTLQHTATGRNNNNNNSRRRPRNLPAIPPTFHPIGYGQIQTPEPTPSPPAVVNPRPARQRPRAPSPETDEQQISWTKFEQAKEIEEKETKAQEKKAALKRKRGSNSDSLTSSQGTSARASPAEPTLPAQPERKLKRPRTRRNEDIAAAAAKSTSTTQEPSHPTRAVPNESPRRGATRIGNTTNAINRSSQPSAAGQSPRPATRRNQPVTPPSRPLNGSASPLPLSSRIEPIRHGQVAAQRSITLRTPPNRAHGRATHQQTVVPQRRWSNTDLVIPPMPPWIPWTPPTSVQKMGCPIYHESLMSPRNKEKLASWVQVAVVPLHRNGLIATGQFGEVRDRVTQMLYKRISNFDGLTEYDTVVLEKFAEHEAAKVAQSLKSLK
ncbi:MAG: hypothetical protein M1829_001912 [Trizodia sp. TS-e1964]|nr:MAG: hypothetical protein M1829_001912 [Trizodia sp. TS-e1964]